jgi:hypothetical protein
LVWLGLGVTFKLPPWPSVLGRSFATDGIAATIRASQATGHPANWKPGRPADGSPDPVIAEIAA